ncbi:MAG: hypothetical protein AABW61_00930 [Candidatus Aenigmatarchaeota archaeon]
MGILRAVAESLNKNKKWIVAGAMLYLAPVFYRLVTKTSVVPILDNTLFLYNRNSQIMPVNLETLGITFLIPCAVGAIVGTGFLENIFNRRFQGFEKYLSRVFGSVLFAFAWIALHFIGFSFFKPVTPWGAHLWAGTGAYARNLLIALVVGPLVPYAIEFVYKIARSKR